MKVFLSILLAITLLQSCGLNEREVNIAQREREVAKKQAELLLKEQQLAQKEQKLIEKELYLDSTRRQIDAVNIYNPGLIGKWYVTMRCTETNCEGSAIGDIKAERWEISYTDDTCVTATAYSGKNISRIYTGYYKTAGLQLVDENDIRVNLSFTKKERMEGTREIPQKNCKIIYSITADKIQ